MRLLLLVARGQLRWSLVWVGLVAGLTLVAAPAYASTYATAADRRAAVVLAQQDAATTLLYGRLPDPGTPAQMFGWEIGAFTTVLVAVAAVLLAVRLTRVAEDAGTLEMVRSCGVGPRQPLAIALVWLLLVAAALAAAAGGGTWVRRGALGGATQGGIVAYAATIGITFLLVAVLTLVLAQVLPTTTGVRRGAVLLVGLAVLLRATGDSRDLRWVSALSPLGLRGAVRPFTDDEPVPLLIALGVSGALAWLAVALEARREPGLGLIRPRATLTRRLHVGSPLALSARLGLGSLITWTIAVSVGAALLAAMGAGVVSTAREGRLDSGFLAEQLRGTDPAAAYFAYTGRIVGIAVAVFVVLSVLSTAGDERSGVLEHVRTTGTRQWSPLVAQTTVAVVGALLVLTTAGLACAAVAPTLIAGNDVAAGAFREIVGQWPATVALAGGGALLAGAVPRLAGLAWILFGASVFLTMLGSLLKVPDPVIRLGVFGHAPQTWSFSDSTASALLVVVGAALAAVGAVAIARRDEVTG